MRRQQGHGLFIKCRDQGARICLLLDNLKALKPGMQVERRVKCKWSLKSDHSVFPDKMDSMSKAKKGKEVNDPLGQQ